MATDGQWCEVILRAAAILYEAALRATPIRLSVCLSVCHVPTVNSRTDNQTTFELLVKLLKLNQN